MVAKTEIDKGKYVTKADGEELVATARGYYAGQQLDPGMKFRVHDKGTTFSWAEPVSADRKKREKDAEDTGYLSRPTREVVTRIKDLSNADLKAYRDDEANGQARKSVLRAMDDEIANRASKPGASTVPAGTGMTEKGGGNNERRFGGGIPGKEPNPDDAVKAGQDPFK